jgi:hypothetical protein
MKFFSHTVVLAAAALFALGATSQLHAQTDYSSRGATQFLTVGPGFAGGASLHFAAREGTKLGPLFAYRITAEGGYPLGGAIRAQLGLGWDSRGIKERSPDNTEVYTKTRVNYFALTPGVGLSAFYLGLNIGFPMSGSVSVKGGPNAEEDTQDMSDAAFEFIEVLLEPRIGATVNVFEERSSWLALTIIGGISLNELMDRGTLPSSGADGIGDYHLATLQLGLSYQFSIPGTAAR